MKSVVKLKNEDPIDVHDIAIYRDENGNVNDALVMRHGYIGKPVQTIVDAGWTEVWREKDISGMLSTAHRRFFHGRKKRS